MNTLYPLTSVNVAQMTWNFKGFLLENKFKKNNIFFVIFHTFDPLIFYKSGPIDFKFSSKLVL